MSTRLEVLHEANRRGILPDHLRGAYSEAQQRGLFGDAAPKAATGATRAPAATPDPQPDYSPTAGMGSGEKLLVGMGLGFTDAGEGVKQIALQAGEKLGMVDPQARKDWEQEVEDERARYERDLGGDTAAGVGRFVGEAAPMLAVPGGAARTLGGKLASGIASGGAVGATQFVEEGETRAGNALRGAAAGGAGSAALAGASRVAGKVINTVKGRAADPKAGELLRLSKQHRVPLIAGDIKGGAFLPKLETATELPPVVGLGKFREGQSKAAETAAARLRDRHRPASDDWARVVQSSMGRKADKVRRTAKAKYDEVGRLADPLGPVPTTNLNRTAWDIVGAELKLHPDYQDKGLIATLEKFTQDPQMGFSQLRKVRSDLGDTIRDHYQGRNAVIGAKGARHLQAVKDALEADMEGFATKRGGDLATAWRGADRFYREKAVPFKDRAIANAVTTDTPDEIYRTFIQRGKRDRARKFYAALTPKGREAVRFGMVNEAFEKAVGEKGFSPARFAGELERIEKASGVFFRRGSKRELDGFTRLMRHAERAGQYMENPPTGQRLIPVLAAGALPFEPGAVLGAGGASLAIKALVATDKGKRFLLAASKLEPDSPGMARLMERVEAQLPRLLAVAASEDQAQDEAP